jgi:hypothetical protein
MMNLRQLGALCGCALLLAFSQNSHAITVTYDYTGNDFTYNDPSMPLCNSGDPGCYSNITASLGFSSMLSGNLSNQTISPDTWMISDGLTTVTSLDPAYQLLTLIVSTDGTGNITAWDILVKKSSYEADAITSMRTLYGTGYGTRDETNYCRTVSATTCNYNSQANVSDNPGTWTVSTVPVPAAAWLFGSGLLSLLGTAGRRKS